jgi:hypothetical protein
MASRANHYGMHRMRQNPVRDTDNRRRTGKDHADRPSMDYTAGEMTHGGIMFPSEKETTVPVLLLRAVAAPSHRRSLTTHPNVPLHG